VALVRTKIARRLKIRPKGEISPNLATLSIYSGVSVGHNMISADGKEANLIKSVFSASMSNLIRVLIKVIK
jgi:hypothetical protein